MGWVVASFLAGVMLGCVLGTFCGVFVCANMKDQEPRRRPSGQRRPGDTTREPAQRGQLSTQRQVLRTNFPRLRASQGMRPRRP